MILGLDRACGELHHNSLYCILAALWYRGFNRCASGLQVVTLCFLSFSKASSTGCSYSSAMVGMAGKFNVAQFGLDMLWREL